VSGRPRYLHQQQYGQRWFFGRFFTDVHQPGFDTPAEFAEPRAGAHNDDGGAGGILGVEKIDDSNVAQVLGLQRGRFERPWREHVQAVVADD
jgi:hypothetical protein